MPHPEIRNHTQLATALLPLVDEAGAGIVALLLQGTFTIDPREGARRAVEQPDIPLGGEPWPGAVVGVEPEWRFEPQAAFAKPGCDLILHGSAIAATKSTTSLPVGFAVGANVRRAVVFGARRMLRGSKITAPATFESIPLRHSAAFGGIDSREPDPARRLQERRNPLGRGFRDRRLPVDDDVELPSIEDPDALIARYGETPAPVGFGFTGAHWLPRASFAGTYDDAWAATRMPLLPKDFDRRHFLAASPGLQSPAPLVGGESVSVLGTSPHGRLDFKLPALGVPVFVAHLRGRQRRAIKLAMDTVIVDTDAMTLRLLWRGSLSVMNGMHDLVAGEFHLPGAPSAGLRPGAARAPLSA